MDRIGVDLAGVGRGGGGRIEAGGDDFRRGRGTMGPEVGEGCEGCGCLGSLPLWMETGGGFRGLVSEGVMLVWGVLDVSCFAQVANFATVETLSRFRR